MKRDCGGSGCGVFSTWEKKWWFVLTSIDAVKVEDHEDELDGEARSMLQHTSLARR
jgi:hypothetical protein